MNPLLPHALCLSANPLIIALLVIFNAGIAFAYFALPLVMLRYVRLRPRVLMHLFVIFILGCGTTHLMQVITMYAGGVFYWIDCIACGVTLVASACTALVVTLKGPAIAENVAADTAAGP